jgi:hypothetical protein
VRATAIRQVFKSQKVAFRHSYYIVPAYRMPREMSLDIFVPYKVIDDDPSRATNHG